MLQNLQKQHVWEKYTGWKDYPNHPQWQYKTGTYRGDIRCFYRCVENLRLTMLSNTSGGKQIYKHRVCFVCESTNIAKNLWETMKVKKMQYKRGSSSRPVLVDLLPVVMVAKRDRSTNAKRYCINCELQIIDKTFYNQSGLCKGCDGRKKAKVLNFKRMEKAQQDANMKKLHDTLAALEEMKHKVQIVQDKVDLLQKEKLKKEADFKNMVTKFELLGQQALDREEEQETLLDEFREQALDREEEDETLLGEFNALRVDVLNTGKIFKTSTLKTLDCMQDLQGKNLEMKEEIARLETEIRNLKKKVRQAIVGIAPTRTSPFGISLGVDIWYYGVYLCGTARFQEGLTNIERQGNIAFYNKNMCSSIRQLVGVNIPILAEKLCHEGIEISLEKFEYLYPDLNWRFAAVDIVRNESSTKRYSLRKEREEIIPLLQSYVIEHDYRYYTTYNAISQKHECIGKKELNALSSEKYQRLFLEVFYFHLEKGKNQTTKDKNSNERYFDYVTYEFYSIDTIKLSFTEHSHGRVYEHLPVHVQLHTYVQTYVWNWQEPRLGLGK